MWAALKPRATYSHVPCPLCCRCAPTAPAKWLLFANCHSTMPLSFQASPAANVHAVPCICLTKMLICPVPPGLRDIRSNGLSISRTSLQSLLYNAVPPGSVAFGKALAGYAAPPPGQPGRVQVCGGAAWLLSFRWIRQGALTP